MKSIITSILITFAIYSNQAAAGFFDNITKGISDAFDTSKQKLEAYQSVVDKPLVDSFYSLSADGKTESLVDELNKDHFEVGGLTSNSITFKKGMYKESNMGIITEDMNNYNYDSASDILAAKYSTFAKSRGNTVRLYKPKMNAIINTMYKQPFNHMQQSAEWYDRDNALIEVDKSGATVSFLVRAHQAMTSLGVTSYQYATIFFGSGNSRNLDNRTNNTDLQNFFMREL